MRVRSLFIARALVVVAACLAASCVGGCSNMKPGNLSDVTPVSTAPRAGNAYLVRGFIGIWSTGMDNLGVEINRSGVNAIVFQHTQWSALAERLRTQYASSQNAEPLVLIGHSYGADDVIQIARELDRDNITVDLLLTMDPVTPSSVPPNVRRCINLYQSNGVWDAFPWFRGVPVQKKDVSSPTVLVNYDIRYDRKDLFDSDLDHFNIEKQPKVHDEIIRQVLVTCPGRDEWAMRQSRPSPADRSPAASAEPVRAVIQPAPAAQAGAPPMASRQAN